MSGIVRYARLVAFLINEKRASAPRLAEVASLDVGAVRDRLSELETAGMVRRSGTDPKPGSVGAKPTLWEWIYLKKDTSTCQDS